MDKKFSQEEIEGRCDILHNSGEHCQNSLNSAAGAALEQLTTVQPAERNRSHDTFHESLGTFAKFADHTERETIKNGD